MGPLVWIFYEMTTSDDDMGRIRQHNDHSWCFKNTNWKRTDAFETTIHFHLGVDKVLIKVVISLLHKGASVVCIPHFSPSGLPAICWCNNPYFKNCKLTVLLSNISFVSKGSVQESIEAENYDQERGLFAQKLWKIVIIFSFKRGRRGHAVMCSTTTKISWDFLEMKATDNVHS